MINEVNCVNYGPNSAIYDHEECYMLSTSLKDFPLEFISLEKRATSAEISTK